jgi:hypothetical protein
MRIVGKGEKKETMRQILKASAYFTLLVIISVSGFCRLGSSDGDINHHSFSQNRDRLGDNVAPTPSCLSLLQNLLLNLSRITEVDAVGEADIIGTGRIEAVINPMMAEIALGCGLFFIVKTNGMVRTFINAKLTPGAFLLVKDDDPVFPFRYGFHWAGLCTGRFITVLADVHTPHEIELSIHEFRAIRPNREVLDPIGYIDWIVFLFAGHFTGLTSPAGELFYDQCVLIHGWPPLFPDRFCKGVS